MQGKMYKIVKILGRMNSRTVTMERFQDADSESSHGIVVHRRQQRFPEAYACCTYYSPNPRLSVLFTHPTPVSPCLAQRGSDMRGSTVM